MSATTVQAKQGGNLVMAGVIATVAATIANVIVHLVANAIKGSPLEVADPANPGTMIPAFIGAPIIFTVVGIVGATIAYGLVKRFSANPQRTYTIIAVVVLILSFIPTFAAPFLPADTEIVFALMHVVAAGIAVPILLRFGS